MHDQQRRAEIARRLTEAGGAHSEYEMTALHGEYDQQWAEWYAHYLIGHDWNVLFNDSWNVAELAEALRRADAEQRTNAPTTAWQDYYGARFAERA